MQSEIFHIFFHGHRTLSCGNPSIRFFGLEKLGPALPQASSINKEFQYWSSNRTLIPISYSSCIACVCWRWVRGFCIKVLSLYWHLINLIFSQSQSKFGSASFPEYYDCKALPSLELPRVSFWKWCLLLRSSRSWSGRGWSVCVCVSPIYLKESGCVLPYMVLLPLSEVSS